VCKGYRNLSIRFLTFSNGNINRETVRGYLQSYTSKAPKTYNNQLCGLRAFVGRFLKHPEFIEGFKKAHVNKNYELHLPTKPQLRIGFEALTDDRERAIYLFYATSGVRHAEGLKLNRYEDVDYVLQSVKSKHNTRTKKAGVSFFNEECAKILQKYLEARHDNSPRLFCIGDREFTNIWRKASDEAGIKISPQIMRKWHSTELGELGVPDRYVDIFQGRAPQSVIGKHYTGKEFERLKRIYDKAGLRLLS
jgi:intergrase/recombinase